MIGTIRKHQQWLWATIITATIISFVIWTGNRGTGRGGAYGEGDFGSVGGEKISKDDFTRARNECLLQYLFNTGNPYREQDPKKATEFEQRIYIRLLMIQKEDQYGVKVSSEKAGQIVNQWIQQRFGRGGSLISMQDFDKALLQPQGLTLDDLDRFARHELGIQELIATVGMGGALITPQEAQDLYRREHQELVTEAVFFSLSNYLSSVTATPETIGQFYSNQMANYRLPDRRQVTYVRFPYTNYFARVEKENTNLNERVEAAYKQFGTNAVEGAKTPEEAKVKIREEMIRMMASNHARDDANRFARLLFESNAPPVAEFSKIAETNGLHVAVTEPFARGEIPKGLEVSSDFTKAAFNLSPADQPYSQPIKGKEDVYILAFNKALPSEIPPFDQIKDKITMDYKMIQAGMQARKAGAEFSQSVSNGIAQGKTFDAVAAEAKQKVVQLPPISLNTKEVTNLVDEVPLDSFREMAFSTQPGKVSPFRPTREGGFIVYVKSTLPVNEVRMKADLPGFTAYVRQAREREAFDSWFRKEFERAHIDAPFMRQQQEEMRKAGKA